MVVMMMMEKQRWAENKTENVQSSSYRWDWEWWRNKNMFYKKVNCSWMEEMDIMDFCDQEKLSFRQDLWPWSKGKMSTWKGQFFQEKWHWAISGHPQYREPLLYYIFLNKKKMSWCHVSRCLKGWVYIAGFTFVLVFCPQFNMHSTRSLRRLPCMMMIKSHICMG